MQQSKKNTGYKGKNLISAPLIQNVNKVLLLYVPVEPYHGRTGEMRVLCEDFQYVLGAISPDPAGSA